METDQQRNEFARYDGDRRAPRIRRRRSIEFIKDQQKLGPNMQAQVFYGYYLKLATNKALKIPKLDHCKKLLKFCKILPILIRDRSLAVVGGFNLL